MGDCACPLHGRGTEVVRAWIVRLVDCMHAVVVVTRKFYGPAYLAFSIAHGMCAQVAAGDAVKQA